MFLPDKSCSLDRMIIIKKFELEFISINSFRKCSLHGLTQADVNASLQNYVIFFTAIAFSSVAEKAAET